jgi:hypothetical protein
MFALWAGRRNAQGRILIVPQILMRLENAGLLQVDDIGTGTYWNGRLELPDAFFKQRSFFLAAHPICRRRPSTNPNIGDPARNFWHCASPAPLSSLRRKLINSLPAI